MPGHHEAKLICSLYVRYGWIWEKMASITLYIVTLYQYGIMHLRKFLNSHKLLLLLKFLTSCSTGAEISVNNH